MPNFWTAGRLSRRLDVDHTAILGRIQTENKRNPDAIKKSGRGWRVPNEIAKRWIAERSAARAFNPKEDITQRAFIFDVLKLKSTLGKGTYKMKILKTIPWEKAILPNGMVANVLPKGHEALLRVKGIFGELGRMDAEYVSSAQVARELGVHPKSMDIWRKRDKLQPSIKIARKHYFPKDLLKERKEDWLGRIRAAERKHRIYKKNRKNLRLASEAAEEAMKIISKTSGMGGPLLKSYIEMFGEAMKKFPDAGISGKSVAEFIETVRKGGGRMDELLKTMQRHVRNGDAEGFSKVFRMGLKMAGEHRQSAHKR